MVTEETGFTLERLGTGSRALDGILGGGIPARSVTVIAGDPGAGKTVFALQMLFHLARQGKRCLYFTTLSEPSLKLIGYMQLFPFFDAELLDDRVVFVDLGSTLRVEGVDRALTVLAERVEAEQPDVVAVDSFKVIHDLFDDTARRRAFIYDLAVQMAGWGATTLLVGEYTPEEVATHPEFAIADGIIRLSNERFELTAVRQLEVLKLRGSDYVTGRHFFHIDPRGVTFYPRVRAPHESNGHAFSPAARVETGTPGLDELLHGGLPRASATVLEGGTGTGKTLLGLQFLLEGARQQEPGVLFTLEETPEQLWGIASGFGWDLRALERQNLLTVEYASPVELSTDSFLYRARQRVEELGARRAMLDSLNSLALGISSERRFRELVYALTKHFRASDTTLVMTFEVPELLGSGQLTGHGVSSIADNVVRLRYVEVAGHLERAISVLKARGVHHETELRRLHVGETGGRIGKRFEDMRGVLTGIPTPASDRAFGVTREEAT